MISLSSRTDGNLGQSKTPDFALGYHGIIYV